MAAKNPKNPTRPKGGKRGDLQGLTRYTDLDLVNRIADRVRVGVPYSSAGMCEGLHRSAVHQWLHRYEKYLEDGGQPPAALAIAVNILMYARGEAEASAANRVWNGNPKGPLEWLERVCRDTWGREQKIEVSGIDPSAAVATALTNLAAALEIKGDE